MSITYACCYFLLQRGARQCLQWVIKHAGLIQGKGKDFHLSVMFCPLFTRAPRREKSGLAASTLPCQLPSPLLPSEMRAINTLGEFKESPLVFLSICQIATAPSLFSKSLCSLAQVTVLCRDLNCHCYRNGWVFRVRYTCQNVLEMHI